MNTLRCQILIIGGGLAGLSALLAARSGCDSIILVNKGKMFASGSTFCNINGRWGLTFAESDGQKELLLARVNDLSQGTNLPELSKILIDESFQAYKWMQRRGVKFLQDENGSVLRVPACYMEQRVAVIIQSTQQAASVFASEINRGSVRILEQTKAVELLMDRERCCGCVVRDSENNETKILSRSVIVASGGGGASHMNTITEPGLTGDALSFMNRVGVPIRNLNYRQMIWHAKDPKGNKIVWPLEGMWNGSVWFRNQCGEELVPSGINQILAAQRLTHVVIANKLDDRTIDEVLLEHCRTGSDYLPLTVYTHGSDSLLCTVQPCVQAYNGGIVVGRDGETNRENLFAVGEVATGMHGADRIGGLMISSAIVFGRRAGKAALEGGAKFF